MNPGALSDLSSRLLAVEAALRRQRTASVTETAAGASPSGVALVQIDPVVLYSTATSVDGTLAWTSLDCSASVPQDATFALASLSGWNDWDGSTGQAELLLRTDSAGASRRGLILRVSHDAYGGSDSNCVLIALSSTKTFDISITAPGIYGGLSVELVGYVQPA